MRSVLSGSGWARTALMRPPENSNVAVWRASSMPAAASQSFRSRITQVAASPSTRIWVRRSWARFAKSYSMRPSSMSRPLTEKSPTMS